MGSGAEEDVPAAADMSEDATQTEADGTADTATEAASTAAAAAAAAAADAVDDDADESADSGDKDPAGRSQVAALLPMSPVPSRSSLGEIVPLRDIFPPALSHLKPCWLASIPPPGSPSRLLSAN